MPKPFGSGSENMEQIPEAEAQERRERKETLERLLALPNFMESLREREENVTLQESIAKIEESGFENKGGRYLLLEISLDQLADQIENPNELRVRSEENPDRESLRRYVIRFSSDGGNSHIGMMGGFIRELGTAIPDINIKDFKFFQSHHEDKTLLVDKVGHFKIYIAGGGYVDVDPTKKKILLRDKSKAFGANLDIEVEGIPELTEYDPQKGEGRQVKKQNVFAGKILENAMRSENLQYTVDPKPTNEDIAEYKRQEPMRKKKASKAKEDEEAIGDLFNL